MTKHNYAINYKPSIIYKWCREMDEAKKDLNLNIRLYRQMFLIRRTEEHIQQEYPNDQMKTPMHMSMGEEAIVVGICEALRERGLFFGTYRSHALYLAVTGETQDFFAELYGKATGTAGGKAGSMHLAAPEKGLILTSAVVGTTIPVAVGTALASKMRRDNKISVSFFGDGATDEGVFWESLNAACLWRLPIIFVCEDNQLAIQIPASRRRGHDSLSRILRGFNCLVFESDTTDVKKIYCLAQTVIEHITNNAGPVFLNLRYYRYLDHVGVNTDFHEGYRPENEFVSWKNQDPLQIQKRFLTESLGLGNEVTELEEKIERQILADLEKAKLAPFANTDSLATGVFHV